MGKKFSKLLAIILSFCILATFCAMPMTASADGQTPLKFGNDGKFKIVIFSDVQDQFPVHQRVVSIMEQAIARENPDLVVFLGDNTEQNIKDPEVDYRRTLNQILAPVVEANVPYALVFGNHDNQSYYSGQRTDKDAMLAVYQTIGDCRTYDADPSIFGTGTCKIPIYASDSNDVAFNLWMVDSNTYQNPITGSGGYDNPHADQLAWMAANQDSGIHSLVFQHIPMPEIYNLLVESNTSPTRNYGDKTYTKQLNANASGTIGEFPNPCPAANNTGEFATLQSMGGVLGVFTGHDHVNDFTGTYQGIDMTAVPGMTYFNYGNEAVRGYGVIELDENDLSDYDYHTVKNSTLDAEAGTPAETTYDDYDVVTYADLRKNGEALPSSYNIHGSNTFTYTATSPTKSAIFKFRWTAGVETGIQFSFDVGDNGNIANPFGVWVKKPSQANAGANGAWHLRPDKGDSTRVDLSAPIQQGDTFDIEIGRLKMLTGDPVHVGQYYVYLKVNGVLLKETYTNTSEDGQYNTGNLLRSVSNEIRFGDWSSGDNGNLISAYVDPPAEDYEPYDVITYAELKDTGGHSLNAGGTTLTNQNNLFRYDATSATHSAIYKLRYVAGSEIYFQLFPGAYRSNDPFAYRIKDNETWEKRYAPNAGTKTVSAISAGDTIDIELARLKVASGDNAGKYHTYLKANGTLLFEGYVTTDQISGTDLDDSIQLNLSGSNSCMITATPGESGGTGGGSGGSGGGSGSGSGEDPDALYYAYDEIAYGNLLLNGSPLSDETSMSGGKTFTYNATSPTYSAILKYRWKACATSKFQLSFDKAGSGINYMFGVQLYVPGTEGRTNTSIRLRPGLDDAHAWNELASNIEEGAYYDIEFARLKVKNGENAGKYYVYFKLNGVLIAESYVAAGVVDENGHYTSNPGNASCSLSNEIYLTFWSGSGDKIMAVPEPETYEDYDEVYYTDFLRNGSNLGSEFSISKQKFTYNKTSASGSAIIRYRWKEADTTSNFYITFDPPPKTSNASESATEYTFAAFYQKPSDSNGPTGRVWLRIGNGQPQPFEEALVAGNDYDVEFARLKVATGVNTGKYKLYFKMIDGATNQVVFYQEKYIEAGFVDSNGQYVTDTDGAGKGVTCTISNTFYMTFWGGAGGNKLCATPVPETYEDYDEVYYSDLLYNGEPVAAERSGQGRKYTYNQTSTTKSAILKLRWKEADAASQFQISFDTKGSENAINFMFGMQYYGVSSEYPNGYIWLRPGYGPKAELPEPIVSGNNYDIEFARLKVKTGPNKGKYYMYFKLNDVLIAEDYVPLGVVDSQGDYTSRPGDVLCTLSNEMYITFWGGSGSTITNPPVVDVYDDYDEIGYDDLISGGKLLSSTGTTVSGGTVYNYARTSASGSAIFKYRWKVGSKAKVQLSFEKTASNAMAYMFGAWLSEPGADAGFDNGRMWLRPGAGPQVDMPYQLLPGGSYNVEFARLKVVSGPHKGQYYVYIKIDDTLIAEDYVPVGTVDSVGDYVSNPGSVTCNVTSGEIFFAHWGSEGNMISAYKEPVLNENEGIKGDFDDDGILDSIDLVILKKILLGIESTNEMPQGLADFNNDGPVDIRDLVAFKKYLAPVNSYAKSGDLVLGTQEHLLEKNGDFTDNTKTAAYIAEASATLGAGIYRLSMTPGMYFKAKNAENELRIFNYTNYNNLQAQVAALKAQGINEILFVADSFILPYGFDDGTRVCHGITVPDPVTEPEYYQAWLEINARGFAAVAELCPDIHYFEPFNEINLTTTRMEKSGCAWNSTSEVQAQYKFTVAEKARIAADLCYYISEAVKAVNPANQVTTPSVCVGSKTSTIEGSFLNTLYNTIESGQCPTGKTVGDVRVDNYFTIVNIHNYPAYTEDNTQQTKVNESAADINAIYTVMQAHNDGGARVWLTETGVSSLHGNGTARDLEAGANLANLYLNKINNDLTFIDTVIFYKLADISTDYGATYVETAYGLFYAGDDLDYPYEAKPIAKTVYSFFHNGSTDYSALDALVARYAG